MRGTIIVMSLVLFAYRARADAIYPELNVVFPTDNLAGYLTNSVLPICSPSDEACGGLVSSVALAPAASGACDLAGNDCLQSGYAASLKEPGGFYFTGVTANGSNVFGTITVNEVTHTIVDARATVGPPDSFANSVIAYDNIKTGADGNSYWLLSIEPAAAATPEGSSIVLAGSGVGLMAAMLWFRRRRRFDCSNPEDSAATTA